MGVSCSPWHFWVSCHAVLLTTACCSGSSRHVIAITPGRSTALLTLTNYELFSCVWNTTDLPTVTDFPATRILTIRFLNKKQIYAVQTSVYGKVNCWTYFIVTMHFNKVYFQYFGCLYFVGQELFIMSQWRQEYDSRYESLYLYWRCQLNCRN